MEASPLTCSANHLTSFFIIGTSVIKELKVENQDNKVHLNFKENQETTPHCVNEIGAKKIVIAQYLFYLPAIYR